MVRHAIGQRKIDYVANVLERLGLEVTMAINNSSALR